MFTPKLLNTVKSRKEALKLLYLLNVLFRWTYFRAGLSIRLKFAFQNPLAFLVEEETVSEKCFGANKNTIW